MTHRKGKTVRIKNDANAAALMNEIKEEHEDIMQKLKALRLYAKQKDYTAQRCSSP